MLDLSDKQNNFDIYKFIDKADFTDTSYFNRAKPYFKKTAFLNLEPSHISLSTTVDSPSFLIFNMSYSKYWQLKIDSIDSPIFIANGYMMACYLDKGAHLIEFNFLNDIFNIIQLPTVLGFIIFLVLFIEAFKTYFITFIKRLAGYNI